MSDREEVMRQAALILANRRPQPAETYEAMVEHRYAPLRERWPDITEDELLEAEILAGANLEYALKSMLIAADVEPPADSILDFLPDDTPDQT